MHVCVCLNTCKSVDTHIIQNTEHVCSENNLRCPSLTSTLLDTGSPILLLHRSRLVGLSKESHISTSHLLTGVLGQICGYCTQLYVGSGES